MNRQSQHQQLVKTMSVLLQTMLISLNTKKKVFLYKNSYGKMCNRMDKKTIKK